MLAKDPKYIIVVDQGSRAAPPVVDSLNTKSLIIDHHLSDEFPENATVSCLLLHNQTNPKPFSGCFGLSLSSCCDVCSPDLRDLQASTPKHCFCLWLPMRYGYAWRSRQHSQMEASISRHDGGLQEPHKEGDQRCCGAGKCSSVCSKHALPPSANQKKARRTSKFDVISAWEALLAANGPKDILGNVRLLNARAEINEEVEKQTHTPPKFSKDGRIAVLRINSEMQVHGVIATRWVSLARSCPFHLG